MTSLRCVVTDLLYRMSDLIPTCGLRVTLLHEQCVNSVGLRLFVASGARDFRVRHTELNARMPIEDVMTVFLPTCRIMGREIVR